MTETEEEILDAPLEDIDIFPHQSRGDFDETELDRLADNIKANGLLQPGVAWMDEGRKRLILVCGERRYRACKRAGLPTMAVKVLRGPLTQGQLLEINISENLQRSSLNPIERGHAFRRMMQLESLTAREVAARLHVSDATVSRDLSLLDLSPMLQAKVASGDLPSSVASSLARHPDEETRRFLAEQYASGKLGRDGVADEVNRGLNSTRGPRTKASRVACRMPDSGVSITVSSGKAPLTWETFNDSISRLIKMAERLHKGGKPLSELSKSLRAS